MKDGGFLMHSDAYREFGEMLDAELTALCICGDELDDGDDIFCAAEQIICEFFRKL